MCILVLGSKPNAEVPLFDYKAIYVANTAGAALYDTGLEKHHNINVIIGSGTPKKKGAVEAVAALNPRRVIVRGDKCYSENVFGAVLPNAVLENHSSRVQWSLQLKTLGLRVITAECRKSNRITGVFAKSIRMLLGYKPQGVSAGLYCLMIALSENEKEKVLVSGISLQPGGHHGDDGKFGAGRALVDYYSLPLFRKFCGRIFSTEASVRERLACIKDASEFLDPIIE